MGGCVRDAIRGIDPEDWDVATSARPEEIQGLFKRSLYTNRFGTVVVSSGAHEIEVTTYRVEAGYADHRRPDEVAFTESLHEDLARRDFTMNAMAWRPLPAGTAAGGGELVDPFDGRSDLEARVVRAVGDGAARFGEDALRMLRAVRFAAVRPIARRPPGSPRGRPNTHRRSSTASLARPFGPGNPGPTRRSPRPSACPPPSSRSAGIPGRWPCGPSNPRRSLRPRRSASPSCRRTTISHRTELRSSSGEKATNSS